VQNNTPITLTASAEDLNGSIPTSSDITPSMDAQVVEGYPTSNYGDKSYLYVQSDSSGSYLDERAWLQFDLSGIPAGATITSATLEMTAWKAQGGNLTVSAHSASDDSWSESGINWNNQPTIGSALDSTTLVSGQTGAYSWDVTSYVQTEYAGDQAASLVLKADSEGSTTALTYAFESKEWGTASQRPRLIITYAGGGGSNVGTVDQVEFFYRYSDDAGSSWGSWQSAGTDTTSGSWTLDFTPAAYGLYEFHSLATDSDAMVEYAPLHADASMKYSCMLYNDLDSDDDGVADSVEDSNGNHIVDSGETNPCSADSDGDGISDGVELGITTPVADPDGTGPMEGTNLAAFIADADPTTTTDPTNPDSDGDGFTDGAEDLNFNGQLDANESDPNDIASLPRSKQIPLPLWSLLLLSLLLGGIGIRHRQ
jgi:hypothetical protein